MKMMKGFLYPAGRGARAPRDAVQPRKEYERAQLQFQTASSPRKRKRSPESPPGPSGLNIPDKRRPEYRADYEADDYLDELGTAALEQYELTQRSPPHATTLHSPDQMTNFIVTAPTGLPTSTSSSASQARVLSKGKGPVLREGEKVVAVSGDCEVGARGRDDVGGEVELLRSELNKNVTMLQELEEKGYERDGEVKLLRTELRKKDEQLRELHARTVSEQKLKEEQFARDTKSLSTQLEFKEQELAALREKCSTLEQRHKQQLSSAHTSPIPHSRPPHNRHTPGEEATPHNSQKKKDPVFLSTETFMPLSQISASDVTPVRVAHASQKSAQARDSMAPEALEGKHIHVAGQSSATSNSSLATSKTKSVAGGPQATSDHSSAASVKTGQPSSSKSQKTSHTMSTTASSAGKPPPVPDDELIELSVPPLEISSRDLLMLLSHRDLLKVPSFESDESNDDAERSNNTQAPSESATSSLPGLFSLLQIPRTSSTTSSPSSGNITTPVSKLQFNLTSPPSASASMSVPPLELSSDSLPKTPVRKSKLSLHHNKPHTCARTDMTRSRMRDDFPLRKVLSASNTPLHSDATSSADSDEPETPISLSLLNSIDVNSLTGNILSMLRGEDSSTVPSLLTRRDFSFSTTPFSSLSVPQRSSFDRGANQSVEIRLLLDVGDVVQRYVTEQMEHARASAMSTSHLSDIDPLDTQSPRGSLSSSVASSRNSSDLNEPSKADQSVVCRSLAVLETLLTYSRQAREQLTALAPPEFMLEGEATPVALQTQLEKVHRAEQKGVEEEEEEGKEEEGEMGDSEDVSVMEITTPQAAKPRTITWKGMVLEQYGTDEVFSKVWVPRTEEPLSEASSSWRRRSASVPFSVTPYGRGAVEGGREGGRRRKRESGNEGRRGRQLFSSLLRLVSPHWKECNEVIFLSLRLLCIVAEDCPWEQLVKFSTLLERDGLDTYLAEPTDPALCLASLTLLTSLVQSPQLTLRLCSQGATTEGCLLLLCYDYFTRTVTEDAVLTHKIRLQLVRLVSSITMVTGGPKILFESPCGCCAELLKSVMTLIQYLVEDAYTCDDLPHSSITLLCSLIALLHKISVSDCYFETHREACKLTFAYSLRALKLLFENSDAVSSTTKYVLSELYLEFYEDQSPDASEDGETPMTE